MRSKKNTPTACISLVRLFQQHLARATRLVGSKGSDVRGADCLVNGEAHADNVVNGCGSDVNAACANTRPLRKHFVLC